MTGAQDPLLLTESAVVGKYAVSIRVTVNWAVRFYMQTDLFPGWVQV